MKFPISKIRSNPFRDLDFNGFDEETLQGLVLSIHETGFWPNLMGRMDGDVVEIAYGHHRIEAARRLMSDDFEVEVAIADLDDEMMLKMMIAENVNQRGNAAANDFEIARAIVNAVADGRIDLGVDEGSKNVRYAPSFVPPSPDDVTTGKPYTVPDVAEFFGWDARRARYVFGALELDELGILPIQDLMGMTTTAVRQLVEATRERLSAAEAAQKRDEERIAELEAQADLETQDQVKSKIQEVRSSSREHLKAADRDIKETAKTVKEKLDNREITTKAIKEVAREIELKNSDSSYRPPPPAARYVGSHKRRVDAFFDGSRGRELDEIVASCREIGEMSAESLDRVIGLSVSLRHLATRASEAAESIETALGDIEPLDLQPTDPPDTSSDT